MNKIELLAPAGDLEKLKMAIIYGADAVYLGGEKFSLRAGARNFTIEELEEGIKFAHSRGKKVYVTINIYAHNNDVDRIPDYVKKLEELKVDAVIVSDPGVFSLIRENVPNMEIHLSTQANTTNYASVNFWYKQGAKRIILARELSLNEIKEIVKKKPKDLDIEAFIHGAMCISYSGRCLLSNYMAGRNANMGECAHPCRWEYYVVEKKRPNQYYPIFEDERGTYIFNSKDLCMIENLPKLIEAGIKSLKIEGRMKSAYYVATVVRSYRMAIDKYLANPKEYVYNDKWLEEIKKASYRDFTTGFYFGKPTEEDQVYTDSSYIRTYDFVGLILDYNKDTGIATVEQRNRIFVGDEVEVFGPNKDYFVQVIEKMWDENGKEIKVAPHPQQIVKIKMEKEVEPWDIIRKARKDG